MVLHISQYATEGESQEQMFLRLIHSAVQQQINVEPASDIWKSIIYCFSPAMSVVEKRVELDWGKLTDLVKCRLKYVLFYGQEQIIMKRVHINSTGEMSEVVSLDLALFKETIDKMNDPAEAGVLEFMHVLVSKAMKDSWV